MANPWLSIPASQYDEHLAHPAVRQREFLDGLLANVLTEYKPRCVALLGYRLREFEATRFGDEVARSRGNPGTSAGSSFERSQIGDRAPCNRQAVLHRAFQTG